MSATQQSERTAGAIGTSSPHRFRAATVEEALRQVRTSLGEDAEIVEASRIRRGGIGGFFATELGVEVVALVAGEGAGTVDFGTAVAPAPQEAPTTSRSIDEPARSPLRARQAWRQAIGHDVHEPVMHPLTEQPMMPGLEAMLAEASRSERMTLPSAPEPDTAPTAAVTRAESPDAEAASNRSTDVESTTFAEHFLRELIQDAEALRQGNDRNRVLPPSPRTLADGRLLPHTPDRDEPPVPPRRRATLAAGATEPLVAPDVLPGMPSPLAASSVAPSGPAVAVTGAVAKRAPRPKGSRPKNGAPPAVAPEPAPQLPLEPATTTVMETAAREPAAATPSPTTAALTELVDRCMQFAAAADRDTAPRKIALAVTLADGGVMKLTVDLPRSR